MNSNFCQMCRNPISKRKVCKKCERNLNILGKNDLKPVQSVRDGMLVYTITISSDEDFRRLISKLKK